MKIQECTKLHSSLQKRREIVTNLSLLLGLLVALNAEFYTDT